MSVQTYKTTTKEFGDVHNGIGSFDGTISFQVKPDCKPYQMSLQ